MASTISCLRQGNCKRYTYKGLIYVLAKSYLLNALYQILHLNQFYCFFLFFTFLLIHTSCPLVNLLLLHFYCFVPSDHQSPVVCSALTFCISTLTMGLYQTSRGYFIFSSTSDQEKRIFWTGLNLGTRMKFVTLQTLYGL